MSTFEPDEEFVTLRDAMARLLEDSWVPSRRSPQQRGEEAGVRLPIDVYITEEAIVIQASLPGVAPEDVEITLEDSVLRIRGRFPEPQQEEGVEYVLRERACGCPFSRTLQLNVPVNSDEAEAEFEEGVLTLTLPKAEEVRPKVIRIKKE